MSTISPKEKRILLIGVTVVLYGIAAVCYKTQMPNWARENKRYQAEEKKLQDARALIAARAKWQGEYAQVCELMPTFSLEQDMSTYWLRTMENVAKDASLSINRRPPSSKEIEIGGVYELPIDCKDWEGSLESLLNFLYGLSAQEGVMLDVRQLFFRPINRPGVLKGTFTLYCAYMRGNPPN
ncbi:MAG: hypothetical protein FWH21_01930 [Kiritimatiellaeota bacterium]|nr:hypothetical protein [Kiritimatiellota bacterium]